jgi:hypothetical protein
MVSQYSLKVIALGKRTSSTWYSNEKFRSRILSRGEMESVTPRSMALLAKGIRSLDLDTQLACHLGEKRQYTHMLLSL